MMGNSLHDTPSYISLRILTFALVFSALVVGLIGWNVWTVHDREEDLHTKYVALVAAIGRIMYLDEVLTMSARMAAASGDPSHEERYNTHDPELSALIRETTGMIPESGAAQYSRETDAANARLVEMERRSFALVHEGRRHEASALLTSTEYLRQKEIYAAGMSKTLETLKGYYGRALSRQRYYQHVSFAVSALSLVILFFGWMLTLRRVRQKAVEHDRAEEAAAESHKRLKAVLDSLDSIVYVADMTTFEILMVNRYARKIFGDVEGRTCWTTFQSGQSGPCPFCTNARLLLPGGEPAGPVVWEFQNTATHQWYECHDQAIRWSDGRLVRMEIATDITERKKTEEESRTIIRTAMEGFLVVDTKGNIVDVNDSYCSTMGYSREELLRMNISDLDDMLKPGEITARIAEIIEQGSARFGSRHRRKDGSLVEFDISINYSPDKGGRFISFLRDVTERNRLENQLRQAQKMEAIGILAGGVAHDFNNILSAIVGYGSLLKLQAGHEEKIGVYADQILASAERASGLTRSLLSFSRKQLVELKPININDIVYGIHRILTRLIGEDIEFKLNLSGQPLIVEVDKGQVEQVLMNLVTNARDAMPHGGKLFIATGLATLEAGTSQLTGGPYALMTVSDTGSGMSADIAEHIFEPFFTTKGPGKGTGLGLSIVYGIIKKHGGDIHVYSEPGEGTIFRIYLPLKPSPVDVREPGVQAPLPSGNETILLVEDDAGVRAATRAMLNEFGYAVIEAVDGDDAVKAFGENRGRIQLVLCDLIMPKKNGKETCAEIRAIRPDIKYIYMSGYTADTISQKGLLEEGVSFLSKPPNLTTLLTTIREVLDGAPLRT